MNVWHYKTKVYKIKTEQVFYAYLTKTAKWFTSSILQTVNTVTKQKTIELNKYIDKSRSCIVPATTDVLTCSLCHCNVSQLVAASSVTSMPWNEKQQFFFSLFLRGGVPSPNFLKLFTILWKFYTTDNFYNFKVLYMTHL